jgi:hypothetical protein
MAFWDKVTKEQLKDARGTQGGLFFRPGNYLVQIQRCKMVETRQKHEAFVAETKVLETDTQDPNLQAGSEPAYFVDLDGKFPELAEGNMADFLRAALASFAHQNGEEHPPVDEITLTPEIGKAVTGEDNLLAGTYLQVHAYNKVTKEGKDFTKFRWRIPENLEERLAIAAATSNAKTKTQPVATA